MLEFERQRFQFAGRKESAIREMFGMGAIEYYRRLNALIQTPAASAFDPETVRRLQRLRDQTSALR